MGMRNRIAVIVMLAALSQHGLARAVAERSLMQPRVPADKLAEARALTSPLPDSPEIVEKGKALYNGKGTCFNCHGKDGSGNGPAAVGLDPSPRNFQHHGFWRQRTEGEIFWVIKHGSSGTSMIGFVGQLTDEEIWTIIQYERSFAGEHGSGMMDHGKGMGPMMGAGGGTGAGAGGCCAGRELAP
jgi:mono/diheme cytochrome c family protein